LIQVPLRQRDALPFFATSTARAPLVTVIIASFNAERTIRQALDSVLAQAFADWELLVCDDASTDSTREIVREWIAANPDRRCRLLALPHAGPAASRNRGIGESSGQFVAFLDDDDFWAPEKLSRCLEAAHSDASDVVCHSEIWLYEDGSADVHHYSELFDPRLHPAVSLFRNNPFSTSALVIRRSRLLDAGFFDASLPSAEDYDLWIRIAMLPGFRVTFLDEPLGVYRVRSGSESSKIELRLHALKAIAERYGPALCSLSRLGALEPWMFRAKSYSTTGIRYIRQGSIARGIGLLTLGILMWPIRPDILGRVIRKAAKRERVQLAPGAMATS
jgi:glycosyltransferase involved in cell wall biosynthesis